MLVSILMPVRDQHRYIGQAVASVLEQDLAGTGADLELVVADGASTDGTLEWLKDLAACDERVRVHSAPDTGPAQAINRAIQRVRGTTLGWLNADDLYAPGAIRRALLAMTAHPAWLAVYGEGEHIDAEGQVVGRYPSAPPSTPFAALADGCFICQPTMFFLRTFALLNGPLDESLRAAFDYEWWLRAFSRLQARIGFVNDIQASSRLHAGTITSTQRTRAIIESMQVIARHLGRAPGHWVLTWLREHRGAQDSVLVESSELAKQKFLAEALPLLEPTEAERVLRFAG